MSAKRLTSSSKKSDLRLNLEGCTSFWAFYTKNRKALDAIIDSQVKNCIRNYPNADEVCEIRQEVLIRMDRCNVLDRFDSTKASINTFITNTANGYIQRHLKKISDKPLWHPWPTMEFEEEKVHRFSQAAYGSLNGVEMNPFSDDNYAEELSSDCHIDEGFFTQEIIAMVHKKLPNAYGTLTLILKGYSYKEIAAELGTGGHIVSMRLKAIKKLLMDTIKD